MEATSSLRRNNASAFLILLLAIAVLALIQLGIHAPIKHGVEAASSVSAMFSKDGTCNKGPSAELRMKTGVWLNLCFHDGGASAWVTSDRMSDPNGREVTTIPREQMSKPVQYLTSVIKRGYEEIIFHGEVPTWFMELLK